MSRVRCNPPAVLVLVTLDCSCKPHAMAEPQGRKRKHNDDKSECAQDSEITEETEEETKEEERDDEGSCEHQVISTADHVTSDRHA